jgi:hypothetical protein
VTIVEKHVVIKNEDELVQLFKDIQTNQVGFAYTGERQFPITLHVLEDKEKDRTTVRQL